MECTFVTNQKGGKSLLAGGYRYTKIREGTGNNVFWRCADRKCHGRAVTAGERLEKTSGDHHHPPNPSSNKVEEIKSTMRKRAREETINLLTFWELTFWEVDFLGS